MHVREIYDSVALGYPAYEPSLKHTRALEEVDHYERFEVSKSLSDEEIIERARTREDMRPLSDLHRRSRTNIASIEVGFGELLRELLYDVSRSEIKPRDQANCCNVKIIRR